jgi:hypothetical protein
MNTVKVAVYILFILIFTAMPVIGAYTTTVIVENIQGVNESRHWVSEAVTLKEQEQKDIGGILIKFLRIGSINTTARYTVVGSGVLATNLLLTRDAGAECIRGTCNTNPTLSSDNAVRISLNEINGTVDVTPTPTPTPTGTASASDNPIYAYVYVDRELPMTKDKVNTFDGEKYLQQTGWTTEGGISRINVYFQRRDTSIPMSISVKAESQEPKVYWEEKLAKYMIESNGKYAFTVKYETKNAWGWKEEFEEIYTLVVTGMEVKGASAAKTIAASTPYEATITAPKTIRMTADGTFEPQNGVTITDNGDRTFTFKFTVPGNYDFNFKGKDGGRATVSFTVLSGTTTTQIETATTANQQQSGEGGDSNWILYIVLLFAFAGLIYMFIFKRKGVQKYMLHAKAQ